MNEIELRRVLLLLPKRRRSGRGGYLSREISESTALSVLLIYVANSPFVMNSSGSSFVLAILFLYYNVRTSIRIVTSRRTTIVITTILS